MPITTPLYRYAIALGSNRPGRHGSPRRELIAAITALPPVVVVSPIVDSTPIGPSIRRFANAVAIIESDLAPPALLDRLKAIEAGFGRRRGRRWGARVIDLDIILWSGGMWTTPDLIVPHPAFRARRFVLDPLAVVAPGWVDPVTRRTMRQLAWRARFRRPVRLVRVRSSVGGASDFQSRGQPNFLAVF